MPNKRTTESDQDDENYFFGLSEGIEGVGAGIGADAGWGDVGAGGPTLERLDLYLGGVTYAD